MKTVFRWNALVACALFGLAVSAPIASFAQTKSKTTVHKATTKAKKKVQAKKATTTKAKAPKPGVVRTGTFLTLKSDDRLEVILPGHPGTRANLTAAKSRRTVFTQRTLTPSPQNVDQVTAANFPTTALIVNSQNTNWWGSYGPQTVTNYDGRYGWITTVYYSWGTVVYTYGYQVVNYWTGNGYVWMTYPGTAGVAYPVLYR